MDGADVSGITGITGNGGNISFRGDTAAGPMDIDNYGSVNFYNSTSAGSANITNIAGSVYFTDDASAGSSTITAKSTGAVTFRGNSTGGNARLVTDASSWVEISGLTSAGMTAGSIEGGGYYYLGSKTFTVGSNDGSTMVSGSIVGTGGSLVKTGSGTLTLSGTFSNYNGGTTVENGTLRAGSSKGFVGNTKYTVNGGTLDLAGFGLTMSELAGNGGTVELGGAILQVYQTTTSVFSGVTKGSGSVVKQGTGTLTLNGTNTHSGGTAISGGTLVVSRDASLGDTSGGLTLDGGTLQLGATFDFASTRNLMLTANGGVIDTNTFSSSIGGNISGAGGLLKTGAGTLTMAGNSGYGGSTTVDGGTLKITGTVANGDGYAGKAAGTEGEVLVAGNTASWTNNGQLNVGYEGTGKLTITNGATVGGTTTYAGYHYGSSGTVTVTGDGSHLTNSGALYVGYLGTGKLTIADGGTVSNSFAGIGYQVGSSGTALVTGHGSTWTNREELYVGGLRSGVLTIADGGTVSNTFARIGDQPTGAGTVMVTGEGSAWTNSSILFLGSAGSGKLTIQDGGAVSTTYLRIAQDTGSTGTLNIGAAAGDTAARAGKLNAPVVNFGSGTGKIVFNHTETNYQFTPDISGNGSVEQIAGTTVLTGTSTYTGTTTVSGGKLLVNGSIASSSGIAVDAGATIGGNGTLGNTIVNGTLSAGNSPGKLTVAGDLTLGAGSTSLFELGAPGTVGGPLNDLVYVTGNLTLGGTLLTPGAVSGYYRLFNVDGSVSGSYSSLPASATIQTAIPHQVNLFIQNGDQIVQFWDGADSIGNGTVDGGAGIWSAGGTNWTGAPGAADFNDQWRGSVAVFTGTGGLVKVNGPVGFEGIQFASDGYRLEGDDLTLTGDSANNSSASFVNVNAGATAEIASVLTGAAGIGLDKFGSGKLVLSGTNTYTGATTIKGGTLALSDGGSIADSSVVTVESGTFDISGVSTSGLTWINSLAGTSAGAVQLGNKGLGITNGSTDFAGVITGDGQIDVGGTQTLSGVNTYTGTTGISGTLALKGSGSISASSFVMVSGTFDISQTTNGTSVRQLFGPSGYGVVALGSKTLTITDAGSFSNPFIGSIQDGGLGGGTGGGVTIARGASQYLSGVSTYTGTTTIEQGGGLWLVNNGGLSSSSSLVVNGLFDIAGSGAPSRFKSLSGSGEIRLGDHDLQITAANGTFSGSISECGIGCSPSSFGKLTLEGGTLTLSGANAYGGGTTIGRFGGTATTLIVTNNSSVGSGRVLLNDAGVFQAGADGLSFANRFEVSPSYGTIDTNGHTMTIAGVIADATDPGTLHKTGAGTLILTNDNTYGDGTVVEAGTLQLGNGGTTGSILGDVQLGGILAFNRSDTYTFSGVVSDRSGSHGQVVQNGTGVVVLAGTNSYSGGTVFNKGTIAVASDGNLGDAAGGLTFDGGTLRYDAAFDVGASRAVTLQAGGGSFDSNGFAAGIASDITGAGGLTKTGAGTLTLSGQNDYTGATTVTQGTLKASAAHSFSARSAVSVAAGASLDLGGLDQVIGTLSGAGNVVMGNGNLTVDETSNSTFSGGLSGGGSFTKSGSGKLMLSGTSTYTGQTFVKQGTLSVNGSIASSSGITVETGGTLGGTGTLASVTVANGGTLAPGNSIGTVTVAGNLVMGAGSTYAVELDPASADRTNVSGTANLSGGTVSTNYAAATYIQKTYTLLNAQGGLGGTSFAGLTGTAPTGFKHKLAYDGNNAYLALDLDIREPGKPGDPGEPGNPGGRPAFDPLNRNQRSVANAIVGYFDAKGGILAEFGALDSAGLSLVSGEPTAGAISSGIHGTDQFLGLLSGEALAGRGGQGAAAGAAASAFAEDKPAGDGDKPFAALGAKSDRLAGRLAKVFDSRWRSWGATYGGTSEIGGDAAAGSHDTDLKTFGLAGGIARKWDDASIGIALGGGSSDFQLADKLGSGSARFFNAGVFGRQEFGNAYVAAAAAYSFYDVETGRTVLGKSLSGDFNAHAFSGRIEAGYDIETSLATLTPYAAFQAIAYRMPGYSETGAGNFGLGYKGNTTTVTRTELGARLDHGIGLDNGAMLTLTGRAALAINGGDSVGFVAGFQALPGTSFSIEGANPDRYSALLDAGIEYATANGFFAAASLQGELSGNVQNIAGTAKIGVKW